MNISPISNISNKIAVLLPFTSNDNEVFDSDTKELKWRNTTDFFRIDFPWRTFASYIHKKYKDVDNVNVVCYGCSDGSEVYSLYMALDSALSRPEMDKFLPIIAKDIDKNMVNQCKTGQVNITKSDFLRINNITNEKLGKYMTVGPFFFDAEAQIKPDLLNNINFSIADIRSDIKNIPSKNTILMCRNFWGYMPYNDRVKFVNNLSKKLDSSSLVAIGNYDKDFDVDLLLEENGFEEIMYNVYQKKDNGENSTNHLENFLNYLVNKF